MSNPQLLLDTAIEHHRHGRLAEATEACEALLEVAPDNADALNLCAILKVQAGAPSEAVEIYRQLIAAHPGVAEFYANYATTVFGYGDYEECEKAFAEAVRLAPNSPVYLNGHAMALKAQRKHDAAEGVLRDGIGRFPGNPILMNTLGALLREKGDLEGALEVLNETVALAPDFAEAHYNLGLVLKDLDRWEEALTSYRRSLSFRPDFASARADVGAVLLGHGNLEEGWREFEWRSSVLGMGVLTEIVWRGEDLSDDILLVLAEQGIGDHLKFLTCIPDLVERARHVIVETDDRLVPLFQRTYPGLTVFGGGKTVPNQNTSRSSRELLERFPDVTKAVMMGSVPRFLRPTFDSFPATSPKLKADPDRLDHWQEWLESLPGRHKIGICWRSMVIRKARTIPFPLWMPVVSREDTAFVSLQVAQRPEEIDEFKKQFGVDIHVAEDLDLMDGIDDTAALLAALDGVVSAQSYLPLLATTVGTPTWRVTRGPKEHDWTFLGAPRYPWLPEMETYFGQSEEELAAILAEIATALPGA